MLLAIDYFPFLIPYPEKIISYENKLHNKIKRITKLNENTYQIISLLSCFEFDK